MHEQHCARNDDALLALAAAAAAAAAEGEAATSEVCAPTRLKTSGRPLLCAMSCLRVMVSQGPSFGAEASRGHHCPAPVRAQQRRGGGWLPHGRRWPRHQGGLAGALG